MEDKQENNVDRIISDFNKTAEKRALKKENQMLVFIVKATARDQENKHLIYKLQKQVGELNEEIYLLRGENEIKDQLLREREEELSFLKDENLKLRMLLRDEQIKLRSVVMVEDKKPVEDTTPKDRKPLVLVKKEKSTPPTGKSSVLLIKKEKSSTPTINKTPKDGKSSVLVRKVNSTPTIPTANDRKVAVTPLRSQYATAKDKLTPSSLNKKSVVTPKRDETPTETVKLPKKRSFRKTRAATAASNAESSTTATSNPVGGFLHNLRKRTKK